MVRCFQLDIRKKIIKIFKILKKHPIPKDRWHICLNKYFFTENRSLEKNFIIKKLLKNLLFSNCDLRSITNWDSRKLQNLSNLSTKEKNTWLVPLKKNFSRKVDTYLKLSYQKNFLKRYCCETVTFGFSQTGIPKNKKIWIIWALKKKTFHFCHWKYLFT